MGPQEYFIRLEAKRQLTVTYIALGYNTGMLEEGNSNQEPNLAVRVERKNAEKTNKLWRKTIKEGMFRDDEPGEIDLKPFTEFYKKSEEGSKFIPHPTSWIQVIEHKGKKYVAKARLLRSGRTSSGIRQYDPNKPNFYWHHFAGVTNQRRQSELLRVLMPELENFNVIVITAHGHTKDYEGLEGNAMSRTFAKMENLQGTLAASIMLVDNMEESTDKQGTFLGASMGGIVGLWHSVVGKNELRRKVVIAAHTQADEIFTSEPFSGMIQDHAKINELREQYRRAFELGEIPEVVKRRNENTTIYLGTEDSIVNVDIARKTCKLLGIENINELPFDHNTMSLGLPQIYRDIKDELKKE